MKRAGVIAGVLGIVGTAAAVGVSTFESADGNMVQNGGTDWANAPNLSSASDLSKSTSDNAFGQGAKEDLSDPTVVTGSIPPNKSDLTNFYVSTEVIGTDTYLYVAWTRSNVLGSANMDFEFNQSTTIDTNGVTPVRTAGDILITFDFVNGGGNPVLGLLTWVTTGSASHCYSANALPCWGDRVDLSAAGFADGAVNTTTIVNPLDGNSSLPALTFGEAGINLTGALPNFANDCFPFASAYLKSRSSASFKAELKDFIAPTGVRGAQCKFKIISYVCKQGANTLYPSTVTFDGDPNQTSISAAQATTAGVSESTLCSLPGAVFTDRDPGAHNGTVTIPSP